MKIKNQKIEEFMSELSSKKPTPGGGAVAALSGAMAAGLIRMVADLTAGKKGYEKVWKKSKEVGIKAKKLEKELLILGDKDIAAYNSVVLAFRSKNKTRIRESLQKASEVPGLVAQKSGFVSQLAKEIAKIGNKNALSDAKTAAYLARAARLSAFENVKINRRMLAKMRS
jgi:formiminotetrahydrofolate cyclodeaminase